MSVANLTNMDSVLKELYPPSLVRKLWYEESPFLALVRKSTNFYGKHKVVPISYAMTAGRSARFTNAQANQAASLVTDFNVTRVRDYSIASVDGETIRATKNDRGAIAEVLDLEIGRAMDAMKHSMAMSCYRNQGGSVGRANGAGAALAASTITLLTIEDVVHFERGMVLQLATTDGTSGSVRTGTITVTAVDRDTGILTFAGAINASIVGALDNDFIFVDGDFGAKMAGAEAWVPATLTATAYFGVDRTADASRLGGIRYTAGSGGPIEQTLQKAAARLRRERAKASHVFLNSEDYANLQVSLGSRVIIDRAQTDVAEIGFESIRLATPSGALKVIDDPYCPKGVAWMTQLDTWEFATLGEPGFLMEDDQKIRAEATADAYQFRIGWYGNLICDAPGYTARVTL